MFGLARGTGNLDPQTFHYSPPSSVSVGSGPEAYNVNLCSRLMSDQAASLRLEFTNQIQELQSRRKKSDTPRTVAESERCSDRLDSLEKRLQTAQSRIERLEREKEALRKKCERKAKQVKDFEAAGLPVGSALPVEMWMPALPGQDPRFVLSTTSIANENEEISALLLEGKGKADRQHSDAEDEEESAGSGGLAEETEDSMKEREDTQLAASGQKRRSGPISYSNVAIQRVQYIGPGANRKRSGRGGTTKDEGALMGKLALYFTQNISIRTLCKSSLETAVTAESMRAEYAPLANYSARRVANVSHTINATGQISRSAMTEAIHASLLALDYTVNKQKLISRADMVSLHFDNSSFNELAMTGLVLELTYFHEVGKDAAGHQRHTVTRKTICCNSFVSVDKKCVDVCGKDGSLMIKEVPFNLVLSLAMSGHLHSLLQHPCKILGADKGPEAVGSGKGKRWAALRKAFLGRGGVLEQIFGTREAIEAVQQSEYWPFLTRVMHFLEVPEADKIIKARPLPPRLDTSGTMLTVRFEIRVITRVPDAATGQLVTTSDQLLIVEPRKTSTEDPFSYDAACKDMDCLLRYCDKHALNRAAVYYTIMFDMFLKMVMDTATEFRKINNHVSLRSHIARILGIKGARRPEACHVRAGEILGPEQLNIFQERFSNGLPRQQKGVASRWLLVQKTVRDLDQRRPLLAVVMPIALANGTDAGKDAAMLSVCSKKGFSDEGRIRFKSKRVERCFLRLTSPDIILQLAVQSFTYTMAWQPLLSACAARRECASSAVGRILRVVDYVLGRGCKVNPVGNVISLANDRNFKRMFFGRRESQEIQTANPWGLFVRLRHRGLPDRKNNGESFVSTRLEKTPKNWKRPEPPALLELYAHFYHPDMATAASRLLQTMREACNMSGPILSAADSDAYARSQFGIRYGSLEEKYSARVHAAQWLFERDTSRAVEAIRKKMAHLLSHPLYMLGNLYDFLSVELLPSKSDSSKDAFPFDDSGDRTEERANDLAKDDAKSFSSKSALVETRTVYVATDEAILNAKLLHRQVLELRQKHGETLHEYMTEPLKSLCQDKMMEMLQEFSKGQEINVQKPTKRFYSRSTNGSKVGLEGLGGVDPRSKRSSYPMPVTAFPDLARLALMACAMITNNNNVESKWSLLTNRYHAHVRHVNAEYMSAIFRQKDFVETNNTQQLKTEGFCSVLAAARAFRQKNRRSYQDIFRPRQEEAEEREAQSSKPQEKYANIKEKAEKSSGEHQRKAKAPGSKRQAGRQMTRHDASESDSDSSRSCSDSEQDASGCDGDSCRDDADIQRDAHASGQDDSEDEALSVEGGRGRKKANQSGDSRRYLDVERSGACTRALHSARKTGDADSTAGDNHASPAVGGQDQEALSRKTSSACSSGQHKDKETWVSEDCSEIGELVIKMSRSQGERSESGAVDDIDESGAVDDSEVSFEQSDVSFEQSHDAKWPSSPSRGQPEAKQPDFNSSVASKEGSSDDAQLSDASKQQGACNADVMANSCHSVPKDQTSESQKRETSKESDVSDIPSDFLDSESDSDDDVPIGQRQAAGRAQGQAGNQVHNLLFPTIELDSKRFQKTSPWKLSFILYLLTHQVWRDTKVTSHRQTKGGKPRLTLTRFDGKEFPLSSDERIFYILYGDEGLEAIHVESIEHKVPASESSGRRQRQEKQWCVTYSRALSTEMAQKECNSDNDFYGKLGKSTVRNFSLGADSLKKVLEQQQNSKLDHPVFHKGDVPRETRAQYIVGFIAWDSVPCGQRTKRDDADLLTAVKEKLTLPATGKALINTLAEIDWVYCGQDFSDQPWE